MTQHPHDQLSKQLLEELLTPLGVVERSFEVPGESKFVDLWFIPDQSIVSREVRLGLLDRIAQTPCLLEPFRNPPTRIEVRSCLLKLMWLQEDIRRKAEREKQRISETEQPLLWVIGTSIHKPILQEFGAILHSDWGEGIYRAAPGFGLNFIAINELPRIRETLILRVLGRGKTQQQAVMDILDLPADDPQRLQMLRILGNWKVTLDLSEIEFEERESIMAFSQAFLEWEQVTEQKGVYKGLEQGLEQGLERERSLIIRQLTRKIGPLSSETITPIQSLSFEQLEVLGEALFDFEQPQNLIDWLEKN